MGSCDSKNVHERRPQPKNQRLGVINASITIDKQCSLSFGWRVCNVALDWRQWLGKRHESELNFWAQEIQDDGPPNDKMLASRFPRAV